MIFVDIDGTLIDFYGTAKKFGIELKINEFGKWKWGEPPYPTPEEFYAKAELQPWFNPLMHKFWVASQMPSFITKDHAEIKRKFITEKMTLKPSDFNPTFVFFSFFETLDKSMYCRHPIDLLIDDNVDECSKWCFMGGISHHFNLADEMPFEKFLNWWSVRQ